MRKHRLWRLGIVCLLLCGCSTRPCADLLDCMCPGRFRARDNVAPHGGVCLPSQLPGAPTATVVPVPAAPVVPAPVPFGNVPPPPPPPP